jgi:septal ring factor EnvC (AmiA/AmiB activator)
LAILEVNKEKQKQKKLQLDLLEAQMKQTREECEAVDQQLKENQRSLDKKAGEFAVVCTRLEMLNERQKTFTQ